MRRDGRGWDETMCCKRTERASPPPLHLAMDIRASPCHVTREEVRIGEARSGEVRIGEARSGEVWCGEAR
jgi:hypothetical protein